VVRKGDRNCGETVGKTVGKIIELIKEDFLSLEMD